MKHWGPEGFDETLDWWLKELAVESITAPRLIAEAGADAMLEALRKMGHSNLFYCPETKKFNNGTVLIIPDDPQPEEEKPKYWHEIKSYHRERIRRKWELYWQVHKATKVIESGYFCPKCGLKFKYLYGEEWSRHWCILDNRGISY